MKTGVIAMITACRATLACALLVVAAASSAQAADPPFGRLFYTPQQRAELDVRRTSDTVENEVVVVESLVTVNGRVSRSSGKTTTWINGVPKYDAYSGGDPSRVSLDDNGTDTRVKVGDTLDRTRGEVRHTIEPGGIEVHVNR